MQTTGKTLLGLAVLLSWFVAVPLSADQASQSQKQATKQERTDRRTMRFRAMDTNADGVITRSEWRGSDRSFERHDWNGDGVLSGAEVWPSDVPRGTTGAVVDSPDPENPLVQSFIRADRNRDGIISRDEWVSDPTTFKRVDVNGDGVITRPEYVGQGWAAETELGATEPRRDTRAYQAGFDRGLADGRQAGKEDKELRNQWDLEGQRELEQADAGYDAPMGARTDYQAGYRTGFRAGYRQGFGPRQ